MIKEGKKILLRHHSGWCIAYDYGFPQSNYIVFKADTGRLMNKLPKSNVAYCGCLENALNCLFRQLIIEHATKNKSYCGRLQDLHESIDAARRDFEQLLKPKRKSV
jgi:hypothetical protein